MKTRIHSAPVSFWKMKNTFFMIVPTDSVWVYGWTHYRMTGQTAARMNKLTHEVEIKDGKKWIKCVAGSHEFFTSNSKSDYSFAVVAHRGFRE